MKGLNRLYCGQMNEKNSLERAAFDYFLEAYNRLRGTYLEFLKHSDKPDFMAKDSESNQLIGIEVMHLFYDEDDAKMLLGRSNKVEHGVMASDKLIAKLNEKLEEKTKRANNYKFKGKMFLVIRIASPIFDKSTFDMFEEDIIIPPNIFNGICLLFYDFSRQAWGELKWLKQEAHSANTA